MRWKLVSLLSCALLSCATAVSSGSEHPVGGAGETQLSMAALKAADLAMKRFVREQPTANANDFYIVITESESSFTVDFVPDPQQIKEGHEGDTPYVEIPSGNENAHGRNIRYVVSKTSGKISATIYPR
jgi:hypothetical protein